MQFNFLKLFLLVLTVSMLSSCLDTTTTTTTTSSDASFVSLTLAGNDSVKTAVFTLDGSGQTIVNIDSLPFRTRIDSVYPTFSFKSSAGAKLHFTNSTGYKFRKDSFALSGKDTVDFRQASWIRNYASNGKNYVNYNIQVNVHKVHPELYIWRKVTDNLTSMSPTSQKAIIFNDTIFYFINDGSTAYKLKSTDGHSWTDINNSTSVVNGFPIASPLNDMIQFNVNGKPTLFVSRDGANIYSSTNGTDWTRKSVTAFTFKSLLYVFNGQLWAVVQSVTDATYHFATSSDGDIWSMIGNIPLNFPVSDFSAITLTTVTGKSKVLVLGGYSTVGALLKNRWSSEDGVYWVDFSTENTTLDTLAIGSSLISYDKKLLLFGKYNLQNKLFYKESKDEGLSWQIPNIIYNQIALGKEYKSLKTYKDTVSYDTLMRYQPHVYQSAVVDKNSSIFLIGGFLDNFIVSVKQGTRQRSANKNANLSPVTDVWTGKLNRKSFTRQ